MQLNPKSLKTSYHNSKRVPDEFLDSDEKQETDIESVIDEMLDEQSDQEDRPMQYEMHN